MPVLPLRGMVVFPGMIVPLFVGRAPSIRAIEAAAAGDGLILFVTQKTEEEAPSRGGLFGVGTVARLLQRYELPDGTVEVLVDCVARAAVLDCVARPEYHEADIATIESPTAPPEALIRAKVALSAKLEDFVKVDHDLSPNLMDTVLNAGDAARMADTVAPYIAKTIADRQALLETTSVIERIEKIVSLMDARIASRRPRRRAGTKSTRPTPAIWFRRRAGEASSSKLGGLPSLPSDIEWPRQHQSGMPLHFLAQIDLSHLPATPLNRARGAPRLPASGLLFFFADMEEEMLWGENGGALANTRVIFAAHAGPERPAPDDMPSIGHGFGEMASDYGSGKTVFHQAALEPNVIDTFSEGAPLMPPPLAAAAADDPDCYNRRRAESPPDWPRHQMLGIGKDIQGTAGKARADGLFLLLQIDSDMAVDEEFVFCDMGAAQFWIKPADLAAGRFNNAWATTEGG